MRAPSEQRRTLTLLAVLALTTVFAAPARAADPPAPAKELAKPGEPAKGAAKPGEAAKEPAKPGEAAKEPAKPGEAAKEPAKPGEAVKEPQKPGEPGREPPNPAGASDADNPTAPPPADLQGAAKAEAEAADATPESPRPRVLEPFVLEPEPLGRRRVHIDAAGAPVALYEVIPTDIDEYYVPFSGPLGNAHGARDVRVPSVPNRAGAVRPRVSTGTFICVAPCDARVNVTLGRTFYVGGPGMPDSDHFQLTERPDDVNLRVTPGSSTRKLMGGLLSLGGLSTLIAGTLVYVTHRYPGEAYVPDDKYAIPSVTLMSVGGAALITGVVLWATSATRYRFQAPMRAP